ncbi:RHS repeat-associated core domain-containing protein [Haloferula chungangensis]|uniref:RHS repeat-associated core domain-containing protein n=1 Tax=Haloferula chungangensis TaxID=1048331 RepID=A0ABW2LDC2_9BACT
MKNLKFILLALVHLVFFANSAQAHYDPNIGRWLSRDPIGEQGGINLYGFVENDGVNRWEFLGLRPYDTVGEARDAMYGALAKSQITSINAGRDEITSKFGDRWDTATSFEGKHVVVARVGLGFNNKTDGKEQTTVFFHIGREYSSELYCFDEGGKKYDYTDPLEGPLPSIAEVSISGGGVIYANDERFTELQFIPSARAGNEGKKLIEISHTHPRKMQLTLQGLEKISPKDTAIRGPSATDRDHIKRLRESIPDLQGSVFDWDQKKHDY